MKKYFILLSIVFLFGCSDRDSDSVATQVNYHFSADETACAFIFYNVEDASPLTIKDNIIDYHFDQRNIITTSSSYDFGWKSKETSGFRSTNYYKADKSKINEDDIAAANGSYTLEGIEHQFQVFHFNFNKQEECLSSDSSEDDSLFRKLIEEIYIKIN